MPYLIILPIIWGLYRLALLFSPEFHAYIKEGGWKKHMKLALAILFVLGAGLVGIILLGVYALDGLLTIIAN